MVPPSAHRSLFFCAPVAMAAPGCFEDPLNFLVSEAGLGTYEHEFKGLVFEIAAAPWWMHTAQFDAWRKCDAAEIGLLESCQTVGTSLQAGSCWKRFVVFDAGPRFRQHTHACWRLGDSSVCSTICLGSGFLTSLGVSKDQTKERISGKGCYPLSCRSFQVAPGSFLDEISGTQEGFHVLCGK